MNNYKRIIDISRPVEQNTSCFPGDVPFSRAVTLTYEQTHIVNLTAFTMSPHVGTHADAPSHIKGDLESGKDMIAGLPLEPFVGTCRVFDVAPFNGELTTAMVEAQWNAIGALPPRVLFRTQENVNHTVFESKGSYFSADLVHELARRGVRLMGIDTASVDNTESKTLDAHRALDQAHMCWLENLDLSEVKAGDYFLVAMPLKFTELEASPLRAALLEW
ncbi:MAG: cyclase family protein [Candidatus Obscuribacterales bacterium]|nr:cyclase family protein [Candidatus Obscuribacterales bacterium]